MKNHIKLSFFIAVVALLATSCEKKIEFDPGDVSPYVVMMSRPENDSLMTVYLGYSRFFLDNRSFVSIDNATLTLSVGGVTYSGVYDSACFRSSWYEYYEKGYYDEYYYDYYGGYRFPYSPSIGDTLRLKAQVPGYDNEVSAYTVVPPKAEVEIVDYICDTTDDVYGDYYFKIRFKIKCRSNRDYYSLRVYSAERRGITDTTGYWDTTTLSTVYFRVNDPIVNSTSIDNAIDGYDGSFSGSVMNFSSEMFTGGEHEFSLEFDRWGSEYYGLGTEETPVFISIRSLSEELYRYNTTRDGYNSDLDAIFSEPVQIYCNIEGGIGILGASSSTRVATPMPRYEHFNHSGGYYFKSRKKDSR